MDELAELRRLRALAIFHKWQSDPLFRRANYLRVRIRFIKTGRVKRPRTTLEALESELASVVAQRKRNREARRKPRKRDRTHRIRRRGRSDEQIKRDLQTQQANLILGQYRRQAAQEMADFKAAWERKWRPLIGTKRRNTKKGTKHRRKADIIASRKLGDHALAHQLYVIHSGPCRCFWCDKYCPNGATVDHIIALANGGSHTSDNICAACPSCNSTKSNHPHSKFADSPILL